VNPLWKSEARGQLLRRVSAGATLQKSLNLIGEPMSFSIVLKYPNGIELRIPVADTIRPEEAKPPKGYRLRLEQ